MLGSSLLKSDAEISLNAGIRSLKNLSPRVSNADPSSPVSPLSTLETKGTRVAPATSFTSKIDYALSAPTIMQKCIELTILLDACPQRDLPTAFLSIVEKIFSLSAGGRGFGISSIMKSSGKYDDYTGLLTFLSSCGPVIKASYKLMSDPYLRFDFPVSLLSSTTQQQIECGMASEFISSKLSGQNSSVLLLNAFEYYIFSFAAYIVQPFTADNKFMAGESLYPSVLEDYLSYFLPCDGSVPPQLPFPVSMSPQPRPLAPTQPTSSPTRKSLLRHGPLLSPPTARSPVDTSGAQTHTSHLVWRSETIINTFSELWLSPFSLPSKGKSESPSLNQTTNDLSIAVGDTLRIVRMMIKHFHFFANSGGPMDVTALDPLKRCIMPNIKKKVYTLFKFIFTNWPHDSSFRLVIETWLSYIQPWRYTNGAARNRANDESSSVQVDEKWQGFVAENILFYTNILRLLLPRFFRMDLTSYKNAYMLFRISKIYSQIGLVELVKRGESALQRVSSSIDFSLDRSATGEMPSLLAKTEVTDTVVCLARECLLELEAGGLRYEPIFGNSFRQTVSEVLLLAAQARAIAEDSITELTKGSGEDLSMMDKIYDFFFGTGASPSNSNEVEELRKSVLHLNQSINSLSTIFDLQKPDIMRAKLNQTLGGAPGTPETRAGIGGRVLTPHGRWQVLQGLAKPDIRYEGDPDLLPINENEVGWLVRSLHRSSERLNSRLGERLVEIYHDTGLQGEMGRMLMLPPTSFYTVEKSLDGGPPRRIQSRHPPRISLRFIGSYKFLIYCAVLILVASLVLGRSLVQSSLLLLLGLGLGMILLALVRTLFIRSSSTSENLDYSKIE